MLDTGVLRRTYLFWNTVQHVRLSGCVFPSYDRTYNKLQFLLHLLRMSVNAINLEGLLKFV